MEYNDGTAVNIRTHSFVCKQISLFTGTLDCVQGGKVQGEQTALAFDDERVCDWCDEPFIGDGDGVKGRCCSVNHWIWLVFFHKVASPAMSQYVLITEGKRHPLEGDFLPSYDPQNPP